MKKIVYLTIGKNVKKIKMDILDKFLKQYSYKFDKGYPDMDNPKDKEKLFEFAYKLTEKKTVLNEQQTEYDTEIKKALGVDEIPQCKAKLKVGQDFKLTGDDLDVWDVLYPKKPLKKDGKTPTAGAGNGEISTYWAYQYNANSDFTVLDSRKGEDPDLSINGIGVELKSYDNKGPMTLGKFGLDKDSIRLLNRVFGVMTLFKAIDPTEKKPSVANTGNFSSKEALEAFTIMHDLLSNETLRNISVMEPFYDKIEALYGELNLEDEVSPIKGAANLLRKMLATKLRKKPMMKQSIGYILNVTSDGKGVYQEISEKTIESISDEALLGGGVGVASSEIKMNFNKLFPNV